ncbi:MAG: winged helix DNA-binding protein [Actinomycetota bacterium]|nr:winged helix DNA-binding protein [Actinomycetota bacterium]
MKESREGWRFLTNHALVLLCIAQERDLRIRDISDRVGITERATQKIVTDLVEGGYIVPTREGRRNIYEIRSSLSFRHPLLRDREIGLLLQCLMGRSERKGRSRRKQ